MPTTEGTMAGRYVTHYITNAEGFWRLLCQRSVGKWSTARRTTDVASVTCVKCRAKLAGATR